MSELQSASDELLLEHIQDGSSPAFALLVKRHSGRFYRIAYRYTANRENAEDVVQESFIKLWENPDIWNGSKNVKFTTWFYRVVVNRCLDHKRKYQPSMFDDDFQVEGHDAANDDILIRQEEQKALEREISALPARQRTALNLCVYEDLSNQEAANIMGINLKALQSLIMRAKTTLKENLKSYL